MVSLYLHAPKNKNRLMPNPFLILANDSYPHTYELIFKSPTHVIKRYISNKLPIQPNALPLHTHILSQYLFQYQYQFVFNTFV